VHQVGNQPRQLYRLIYYS